MKFRRYFLDINTARGFAWGLEAANDGNIHTLEVDGGIDPIGRCLVTWHNESRKPSELPEKHPPLTSAEYVACKGNFCPVCRGEDLQGHSIEVTGGNAYQRVTCDNADCEASWVDCYEISGYDRLER